MTTALYRRDGKKRYQGYLVTRLDTADDRVDELCRLGWARTPYEAYNPKSTLPEPEPALEPEPEPELEPEPVPRKKRKKNKKKSRRT